MDLDEPMDDGDMDAPCDSLTPCVTLSGQVSEENKTTSSLLRPGSMVMMTITDEDYQSQYWPKLETAIHQLLTLAPGEYIPISYEQMYSCVYKCVCKGYSEKLYENLTNQLTKHLEQRSQSIQTSEPSVYIEQFNNVLSHYLQALSGVVPIFNYMNRFHVVSRLKTDLNVELSKLFVDCVANKHVPALIPLLVIASTKPFQVSPGTMANLIKNIYNLNPPFADMHPQLFAKYLPNILPPCREDDIDRYIEEARQIQQDLRTHPSYVPGDNSKKRHGCDDSTTPPSLSLLSTKSSPSDSMVIS